MSTKETHYFVLQAWKNEDGKIVFDQDYDTQEARFPEGSVWSDEAETWERKNSDEFYTALITKLGDDWDGIS